VFEGPLSKKGGKEWSTGTVVRRVRGENEIAVEGNKPQHQNKKKKVSNTAKAQEGRV